MANNGTLLGAIQEIQAGFRKYVDGLQQVPELPPEKANAYPFVVSFPLQGNQSWEMAGFRMDSHDIQIELHVMRKDLPLDLTEALGYVEKIPNALKSAERAGELSNICSFGAMEYTFGVMAWSDTPTVGFTWVLRNVKIEVIA